MSRAPNARPQHSPPAGDIARVSAGRAESLARVVREALLSAPPPQASTARFAVDELLAMASQFTHRSSQVALQAPFEALQVGAVDTESLRVPAAGIGIPLDTQARAHHKTTRSAGAGPDAAA